MLVKLILEDRNGNFLEENQKEIDMSYEEVQLLLQTDEVYFPSGWRGTFCHVVHTIFEMVQEPRFIEIHLKEHEL